MGGGREIKKRKLGVGGRVREREKGKKLKKRNLGLEETHNSLVVFQKVVYIVLCR